MKKALKQQVNPVGTWRWRIAKAGLTMRDFAISIGSSQSQFSDWVRGAVPISQKSINRVESALQKLGV